jgi:alpha-galactosidase
VERGTEHRATFKSPPLLSRFLSLTPSPLARVLPVGLYDHGYRHFHLDDCWAGPRNSTGFLTPEADHFPNGMKPVVDYVHSLNLTFGLYTCAGTKTCVGGRPGSKDHWKQDADLFAEWGVDWVSASRTRGAGDDRADT